MNPIRPVRGLGGRGLVPRPIAGVLLGWALGASRAVPPPAGACAVCGYDLAGLDATRCPECGVVREASS